MVWLKILFFLLFSLNVLSEELNSEELKYFNFLDFNNDTFLSIDEVNQSLIILFQLIDSNQDKKISKKEIMELKNIFDSLKWVFGAD